MTRLRKFSFIFLGLYVFDVLSGRYLGHSIGKMLGSEFVFPFLMLLVFSALFIGALYFESIDQSE